VDYHKLNSVTTRDAYRLPRIDESLDALDGSKFFSMLDLLSEYWQVPLSSDAQEKAACKTWVGSASGSCCRLNLHPLRPPFSDTWSRASVGYAERPCSSTLMMSSSSPPTSTLMSVSPERCSIDSELPL